MKYTVSQIVTGDDTDVSITLYDANGVVVNVSAATEIKARLVKADRSAALTPIYTCSSGATGASWSTGVVVVSVAGTDTAALVQQDGVWEVQVTTATGKTTYLDQSLVKIITGWIP
jgi:hypothetical protein